MTLSRRDLEDGRMRALYIAALDPNRALTDAALAASLEATLGSRPTGAGWWGTTPRTTSPACSTAAAATSSTTKAKTETATRTAPVPGGGAGKVWVNTESHVYHKEGSRYYGTTKTGKYMSEADAVKEGDRPAKN